MRARCNLVLTRDGRIVPEGAESGWLWRIAGAEVSAEEAERYGVPAELLERGAGSGSSSEVASGSSRVIEPEVRRTRRRTEAREAR